MLGVFAALDASQEQRAVCMAGQDGVIPAEAKVPTCPEAIANWISEHCDGLERVGIGSAWRPARRPSGSGPH